MDKIVIALQSLGMADQTKISTHRSDSNVFAFRCLKWGDPPQRFRMDYVSRRRVYPPIQPLPALPDADKARDGEAGAARPSMESQARSVADLDQRRMRECFFNTAAWGAAIVSVAALAAALVWTGWGWGAR